MDLGTPLNPDPIQIRIHNTYRYLQQRIYLSCFQGEFACDQCGKVLKSKGSLDYHKRTHSGEYAYRSALQYETLIIFCCYVRIGVKSEL
jgi:hypothetical protein